MSPIDPKSAWISDRQANQVAFRKAYSSIQDAYTPGRFVAISDGQIVADADRFEELRTALISLGKDPTQVLIIQAGVEYPESAVIFLA